MAKKGSNDAKIERELKELDALLGGLPLNPIPWATVITILAPIVARLAVRYALKKAKRSLSEEKVNAIGNQVGTFIGDIIARRVAGKGGPAGPNG